MCFDVPKVVRSPGCDHGHDEESRNGRDIKIDILDDYLDTGMVPGEIGTIPELREVIGTPREVYEPFWALVERRGKEQGRGPPQAQSELGGGPAPLSFLPLSSFLPLLLLLGRGESYSRWE